MNRYSTPRRANASASSSACREEKARSAIAEPRGEVLAAPAPVLLHRLERAVGRVVEDRLVGVDERVVEALRERPPRRRFEVADVLGIELHEVDCSALPL